MKNILHYTLLLSFVLGNIILLLSRQFRDKISDFELGFFEGVGIVLTLAGTGYLVYYAIDKKFITKDTKK